MNDAPREGRCDRACCLWNKANRDSEWRARRASDSGATFLILLRHRADQHRAHQIEWISPQNFDHAAHDPIAS